MWLRNSLKLMGTKFVYKQVYIEKKNIPMIALQIYKSIPMTALWCPAFSNHG